MKAKELTKDVLDEVFAELVKERRKHRYIVIATQNIANRLWKKYHLRIWKDSSTIKAKIREWWNSYPWKTTPRFHKLICGVAVYLSAPWTYDYCMLEKDSWGGRSLICIYDNQSEFLENYEEVEVEK